ncbi:hypothetical protein [uncultured Paraglaciecola sp.]|uniref:hypothetical protein n=1 Tax=uncultured Paraglaciecola sp. TaxID=1765024 RepID=UPI0026350539|nr:hypothetical protein [uncultured Paraglaciecola sp.]
MQDSIYIDHFPMVPPREQAESDQNYTKHVHCDGARFHVLSYTSKGVSCSERDCIINKPKIIKK